MTFGERLKFLREQKGMSQEEVAKQFGVSRQTVSKWELDKSEPTIEQLKTYSLMFDKSLDELITGNSSSTETKWQNFLSKIRKQLPSTPVHDVIEKKGNIKNSRLGHEFAVGLTDVKEAFNQGFRLDTVMLIDKHYYPENSNGVGRQQCLVSFEETKLSFKAIDWAKVFWKKHLKKIAEVDYQEIVKVKIGMERRTGVALGLLSNHPDACVYYLHVDIYVDNGQTYLLSCSQFEQLPQMLHYLRWHYVEIEDPMKLADVMNNEKIIDPVSYIKEHYEQILPVSEKETYDHLLGKE